MFEDTKGLIRSRKSKKDRQILQPKEKQRTNNNLQSITQEIKDRATRTLLIVC